MRRMLIWAIFLATGVVYLAMALWSLPKIAAMAGGQLPFDFRPMGYTPEAARAFLSALTAEGRSFYLDVQHRLDLVFPGLLALSLILLFRRFAPRWPGAAMAVVALAGAVFDWGENAAVARLLTSPDPSQADLVLASRMTVMKSLLVSLAMVAALGLIFRAAVVRWRR